MHERILPETLSNLTQAAIDATYAVESRNIPIVIHVGGVETPVVCCVSREGLYSPETRLFLQRGDNEQPFFRVTVEHETARAAQLPSGNVVTVTNRLLTDLTAALRTAAELARSKVNPIVDLDGLKFVRGVVDSSVNPYLTEHKLGTIDYVAKFAAAHGVDGMVRVETGRTRYTLYVTNGPHGREAVVAEDFLDGQNRWTFGHSITIGPKKLEGGGYVTGGSDFSREKAEAGLGQKALWQAASAMISEVERLVTQKKAAVAAGV